MRKIRTCISITVALLAASQPTSAQGTPPTPAITQPELVARLGALLDSLTKAGQFSGVVSLSLSGAPVFERGYGEADRARHIANDTATAFNIGSINKIFTSIAIRQLALDGRLALDSTLAHAWPDYPNADVAKRITIRQLLQHTSGVTGDIFAVRGPGGRGDVRHNRDLFAGVVNNPLAFEPGSRNQYSNAGFVVLGALIEHVSGQDYYAYIQKHILSPAGMTRTGHFAKDSLPPHTALGYTRGDENAAPTAPLRSNIDLLPGRGSAAGGGYSTVGDMKRFLAALRARSIFAGPPAGLGIAGGAPGLNAVVEGALPGGYDLVVMANLDPPAAERVARRVREWMGTRD